ncbi:ABC-2 type transport system permease protein [Scopulibacillus daqui]|uniref:ABC-2 type transport system permease protein n=1 Tax=Scopulibacillus daqui TaxID=1469162 RepID=A0ABS2PV45_9BACL|nr:ABC transporter permease [Scopulibacillus daqui]MBM7643823.1 ABC-2 type transport system permease protein [Scopulibacillus daqui]
MDKIEALWNRRRSEYWKMASRYWKLITMNSGLTFVLYVILIVGSIYYKKWLDTLTPSFPSALLIALAVGIFVIRSPIRTFIESADLVFLLPLETQLEIYFKKSRLYSFQLQCVTIIVLLVLFSPLYFRMINHSFLALAASAILIFAAKWWNIDCKWQEQYIPQPFMIKLVRAVVSFGFVYAVVNGRLIFLVLILICVMAIISLISRRLANQRLLKWDRLLEMENKQLMILYRFANLFTDVPQLKGKVKPRFWLNALTQFTYGQPSVFKMFYAKTFIRSHEYFGMFIRLTVAGMVIELFLTNGYSTYFILLAVMYISAVQLLTLWRHITPQALADLYPIHEQIKQQNYLQILFSLLVIQGVLLSIAGAVAVGSFISFIILLILSLALNAVFTLGYVRAKIKSTPV